LINGADLLEIATYPGGEVRIGAIPSGRINYIKAHISDSDGIIALQQLADLLRRQSVRKWGTYDGMELPRGPAVLPPLILPYVPYARQDRVKLDTVYNQSHALRVFCDTLNAMGWSKITIWDPHSDVAPALINNVEVITRTQMIETTINQIKARFYEKPIALVVPDAGALKASLELAEAFRIETVCQGEKVRNMRTGEITGSFVHNVAHLRNKVVLIADDICDGGRTFTGLAEFVRGHIAVEAMVLYVTHGIFSKGMRVMMDYFNMVATPNQFMPPHTDISGKTQYLAEATGIVVNTYGHTVVYSN
jgi:ribose-phosphate pyrophosphokinase